AHLRIYDGALTQSEIRLDMRTDESSLGSFNLTHPLDFNFYNKDNHHVLYIDDSPTGQNMYLDLTNTSRQNITLNDIGKQASRDNYHFALRFRNQTIATPDKIQLTTEGWSLDR